MKKTLIISILILTLGTLSIGATDSNTTENNGTIENNLSAENNLSMEHNLSIEDNLTSESNVTLESNATATEKCGAGKCGSTKEAKCGTEK